MYGFYHNDYTGRSRDLAGGVEVQVGGIAYGSPSTSLIRNFCDVPPNATPVPAFGTLNSAEIHRSYDGSPCCAAVRPYCIVTTHEL